MTTPSLNGQQPSAEDVDRPNHVRFHHSTTHFSETFGGLYSVDAICLDGEGHTPHVEVRWRFGLRLDFDPEDLLDLYNEIPRALAKLKVPLGDVLHDAVGVDDE